MPVTIQEDRPGFYLPVIICHVCQERVTDAAEANVEFSKDAPENIYTVHKSCGWQLRSKFKSAHGINWMGLDEFLVMQLQNASLNRSKIKNARKSTERWNLVSPRNA
jgi:hypothetical protein